MKSRYGIIDEKQLYFVTSTVQKWIPVPARSQTPVWERALSPVKRGLAREPEHWRYSSAASYTLGVKGELEIDNLE